MKATTREIHLIVRQWIAPLLLAAVVSLPARPVRADEEVRTQKAEHQAKQTRAGRQMKLTQEQVDQRGLVWPPADPAAIIGLAVMGLLAAICGGMIGGLVHRQINLRRIQFYLYDNQRLEQETLDQRRMIRTLRDNQEQLARAEAISMVMSGRVALNGGWIKAPPRLGALLGYSQAEIEQRGMVGLIFEEDRRLYQDHFDRLVAERIQMFDMETRLLDSKGRLFWFTLSVSAVRDSEGKLTHALLYAKDVTREKAQSRMVMDISRGISTKTGEGFFNSLVEYLSRVLGADYVLVGVVNGQNHRFIRTVVLICDGVPASEALEYDLTDTPCDVVIGQSMCIHPQSVAALYPQDRMLTDMGVEGYAGTRLTSSSGKPLGIMAALFRKPIEDVKQVESILRIFALRAAAELERRAAEVDLRQWMERYELAVKFSGQVLFDWDVATNALKVSGNTESILGYTNEQMEELGINAWLSRVHPDDMKAFKAELSEMMRLRRPFNLRYRLLKPSGDCLIVHDEAYFVEEPGRPQSMRMVGFLRDVSEQVKVENRQKLMMDELDHRVKNNLAAVQSLATQTLASSRTLEEFNPAFLGRLRAMANTHESLARSRWEGLDLETAARRILSAFGQFHSQRIMLLGPQVMLVARAALPLGLAMHELATNALKYGAWSNSTGVVQLSWGIDPDGCLDIRWTESGGPPVNVPEHQGLGTRLIEGLIGFELGATVKMTYPPDGLICHFRLPGHQIGGLFSSRPDQEPEVLLTNQSA